MDINLCESFLQAFWENNIGDFRTFSELDESGSKGVMLKGSFADVKDALLHHNSMGHGIFFVPNQGGQRDSEITTYNALWIDIDNGPLPTDYHLPPTMVLSRGPNNHHIYWHLSDNQMTASEWTGAIKRLIKHYGSDPTIKNPSRVMRLPEFPTWKPGKEGTAYEIVSDVASLGIRWSLEEVVQGLPIVVEAAPTLVSTGNDVVNNSQANMVLAISALERHPPAVQGSGKRDNTLYQAFCVVRDFGLSSDVAMDLIKLHYNPRCQPPQTDKVLINKCNNAYSYAKGDQGHKSVNFGPAIPAPAIPAPAIPAIPAPKPISPAAEELTRAIYHAYNEVMDSEDNQTANKINLPVIVNSSIIDLILRRVFWVDSRLRFGVVTDDNRVNYYEKAVAFKHILKHFGSTWDLADKKSELKELSRDVFCHNKAEAKAFMSALAEIPHTIICDHICREHQATSMNFAVDMFAHETKISMNKDQGASVMLKHSPYDQNHYDHEIIDDYKEHFPKLDEVLEFLVASRFASDRKQAYLWMRCDSDWGKSFFQAALARTGCSVDCTMDEIKKMGKGEPCGKSPNQFRHAYALIINEVSHVNRELKSLENELRFSPKNQLECKVPLYAKLLFSAENIESLVGEYGVEDQFANRICKIDCTGRINDRPMFNPSNKSKYFESVSNYIAEKLNNLINIYLAMGDMLCASSLADVNLDDFFTSNSICKGSRKLTNSISDIVEDFLDDCEAALSGSTNLVDKSNVGLTANGNLFIISPKMALESWINRAIPRSYRGTIQGRISDIRNMLGSVGNLNVTRNGIKSKCRGIETNRNYIRPTGSNVIHMTPDKFGKD